MQVLDAGPEQGSEEEHLAVMDTHARLVVMRHKIFENPQEDLDEWAKKLRQANFKQQYKRRQETPFHYLPFKPTPEQQAKLLQEVDARRRENAAAGGARPGVDSAGMWAERAATAAALQRSGSLGTARHAAQADAETTCSSEEDEDDDEERGGAARSRSRGVPAETLQAVRRTSRRPQRPRRFADVEMYDDGDDPDYAPVEEEGPPRGVPSGGRDQPGLGGNSGAYPFGGAGGVSERRDMAQDGGHGSHRGHRGDVRGVDDFVPQTIPGFPFPGLPQPQRGLDDSFLPSAPFMSSERGFEWNARQGPQPGLPSQGYPVSAMRYDDVAPHGGMMDLGHLMPQPVFHPHASMAGMHVQPHMSLPMAPGPRQELHRRGPFQQDDGTPGVPTQRSDMLREDSSGHNGLDTLLHASALASPLRSGQLTAPRQNDIAFPDMPYPEPTRKRRISSSMWGGPDYGASASVMHAFAGRQRQLQHAVQAGGLEAPGLGHAIGQGDGLRVHDMLPRVPFGGRRGSDGHAGVRGGL